MSRTGIKVISKNKIQKSASQKRQVAQKLHVADFERVFWSPFCEMFHNITSEPHNGISYIHLHKCLISLYSLSASIKTQGKTAAEQVV